MTKLSVKQNNETTVIHLISLQNSENKVLVCEKCGDVCWYRMPVTMPLRFISCDYCKEKGLLTDDIPRSDI